VQKPSCAGFYRPNIAFDRLQLLLHAWHVRDSNLGPEVSYPA